LVILKNMLQNMLKKTRPHWQTLILLAVIVIAYLWLQLPVLSQYSLQAFAGAVLVYFLMKRVKKAKIWHVLPEDASLEMALLTFAFLLLIGYTGNIGSYFYPLTYLHLFLLVMTTAVSTAIIGTLSVMIFHYALTPALTSLEIGALLAFPLLLMFFLFAKNQYTESQVDKARLEQKEVELENAETGEMALQQFIDGYLKPKLQVIEKLLAETNPDLKVIKAQLSLLESESGKMVGRVNAAKVPPPDLPQESQSEQDNQDESAKPAS